MGNFYNWLQERRASAIAQDADFKEEDHPRNDKGGKGGGRFRTSGKTIEKEDEIGDGQSYIRKPLFEVGQRVKFRDPEFEDGDVHTVTRVIEETINGHPWKHKLELENGVRRYDDHFLLA